MYDKTNNLRELCAAKNLKIEPFGPSAWRIYGKWVDVLARHLEDVDIKKDLAPVKSALVREL